MTFACDACGLPREPYTICLACASTLCQKCRPNGTSCPCCAELDDEDEGHRQLVDDEERWAPSGDGI